MKKKPKLPKPKNKKVDFIIIEKKKMQNGFIYTLACNTCGKKFKRKGYEIKAGVGKYCSNICKGKHFEKFKGAENHTWRGGVIKHSQGYKLVYAPNHPRASKKRPHVYEHILVMEKQIGRYTKKNEQVHHINHKTDDNRIKNLQLVTSEEHIRIHRGWKKEGKKWFKKCSTCKRELEVNKTNFYTRSNGDWISPCKRCANRKKVHICKNCKFCSRCLKNIYAGEKYQIFWEKGKKTKHLKCVKKRRSKYD